MDIPTYEIEVTTEIVGVDESSSKRVLLYEFGQTTGSGIKSGIFKLQITDPNDPLFLYDFEVSSSDFSSLKEEQKLYCEFHKFSDAVHDLLRESSELKDFKAVIDQKINRKPILLILQMTRISLLTHIRLVLEPASDARLNQFLSSEVQKYKSLSSKLTDNLSELKIIIEENVQESSEKLEKSDQKLEETKKKHISEKNKITADYEAQIKDILSQHNASIQNLEREKQKAERDIVEKYEIIQQKNQAQYQSVLEEKHRVETLSQRQSDKIVTLESQLKEANEKIQRLDQENKELSSGLIQSSKQGGSLKGELDTVRARVMQLEEQIENNKSTISSSTSKTEELKGEIIKKNEEIEELKKLAVENEQKARDRDWILTKSRQVIAKSEQDFQKLKEHYENRKKEWINKEERLKNLEIETARAIERERALSDSVTKLEQEVSILRKKNSELEEQCEQFKTQHETDQTVIDHLNNQLNKHEFGQFDLDDTDVITDPLSSPVGSKSPTRSGGKTPGLSAFLQPLQQFQSGQSIFDSPAFF